MSGAEKIKVDWSLIEVDYRAGVKSLEQIGKEYGVTKGRISQVAKRDGWVRDLKAKIKAKAEARVNESAVNKELNAERVRLAERDVVEANAELQYRIRIEHRQDIGRTRKLFKTLLGEIETATQEKGGFEAVLGVIEKIIRAETDEDAKVLLMAQFGDLEADVRKLVSINNRIDSAKKLTEILERLVKMEREAFGITDGESGDGDVDNLVLKLRRLKSGVN